MDDAVMISPIPFERDTSVLFIGNSYTYFNDMPGMLAKLAHSAGYVGATVDSVTKGGYTLEQLCDDENEHGRRVSERLSSGKYDFIVLQEQSLRPAEDPEAFYAGVRDMLEKISRTQPNAALVLYETWGRKAGHRVLADRGWSPTYMYQKLRAAYGEAARRYGCRLSRVGGAFAAVCAERGDIELYNEDMSHPSRAGSYLAACVHYTTVFGRSPVGLGYIDELSPEDALYLQSVAANAALCGADHAPISV